MATHQDLSETIAQQAASGVQSASVDGMNTTAIDIEKLIAADRYLSAKRGAGGPLAGVGLRQVIPQDHR
jgi:hypothetical protein